jgi:hypothetical protein
MSNNQRKLRRSTFPFNVEPTQPNTKPIDKEQKLRELKRREQELLQAKRRLENYLFYKKADTEEACRIAKQQAQKELAKQIDAVLPNTNSNYLKGAARSLAIDVKKVVNQYKK